MSEQVRRKLKAAMQENASLKAEVERLRKAGDAMAYEIINCYLSEGDDPSNCEYLSNWNAAKEGKHTK